jgi:hypothetical protein
MKNQRHVGLDTRTAFERLIDGYLERIQDELMPEKAKMVVAINTGTGEYVLGNDSGEAAVAFRKRWPKSGYFMCRVDGTPSGRM